MKKAKSLGKKIMKKTESKKTAEKSSVSNKISEKPQKSAKKDKKAVKTKKVKKAHVNGRYSSGLGGFMFTNRFCLEKVKELSDLVEKFKIGVKLTFSGRRCRIYEIMLINSEIFVHLEFLDEKHKYAAIKLEKDTLPLFVFNNAKKTNKTVQKPLK